MIDTISVQNWNSSEYVTFFISSTPDLLQIWGKEVIPIKNQGTAATVSVCLCV